MQQLSFFNKPRIEYRSKKVVKCLKDITYLSNKFKLGKEFEIFRETKEHYIIYTDNVFYHIWKRDMRVIYEP